MKGDRMKKLFVIVLSFIFLTCSSERSNIKNECKEFLKMYNQVGQRLYTTAANAEWKASTDVKPEHTGQRIGANEALAAFMGSKYVIEKTKNFLKHKELLDELDIRQLEEILLNAASAPGTIPEVVSARIKAEANQSAILDGFEFCVKKIGDRCIEKTTPNRIDEILLKSVNLNERKKIWEVSKQTGPALKPGLIELQKLRNQVAQEMGFSSFFHLQVADYKMSVKEMTDMMQQFIDDLNPLYLQLHTWAKYKLAEKYKQPVPDLIPAHWISNRWAQSWPGLVEGVDLDYLFKGKSPEWIVQQAENFYISLGMPPLPKSFYEKSDLYELPPDSPRKKNTHASAWHIDYEQDVRSLMSVKSNYDWFETTHHELGHIYYYLAYSNPDVPVVLRGGANRAFHEAIGELISLAVRQPAYLKEVGVMPADMQVDRTKWLLAEALDNVVFIPWSAGVMTFWERDFYEEPLPVDQFNKRWWEYVKKFQGIVPPEPRGEEYCDAATKTHINDDPAQYYDYAMAFIIKYQLHMYIAKNILKQDPHNCNYYGNKEVGKFLWNLLKLGKTKDWRVLIREVTGEDVNSRAMLEYFSPVMKLLEKENSGKKIGWN